MSDYISRQAALEALKEAHRNNVVTFIKAKEAVSNIPSVDVVEVIRCKDCKHRDAETLFCEGRGWPMQLVPDDGFCDKGESDG